jgi:predicted DNA-binding transcriptional regulator AlpA
MEAANDNTEAGDLLMGARAIASHLGINIRQAYRLIYADALPTFKLGGSVAARRSSLAKWFADAEKASA